MFTVRPSRIIPVIVMLVLMSVGFAHAQDSQDTVGEQLVLADFEGESLFLGKDSDGLDIGFVP